MSEATGAGLTKRRVFAGLLGTIGAGAVAKLGYDRLNPHFPGEEDIFPNEPQKLTYLAATETDTFGTIQRVENSPPFDPTYLPKLFEQLKSNKGSREVRAKSVVEHVHRTGSGSNCLMLDEAGVFLAAGHTYGSFPGKEIEPMNKFFITWMLNPKEKVSYLVRQTVIYPGTDLALVYAPTGKPFKALPIEINSGEAKKGEDMWSYGAYRGTTEGKSMYALATLHGKVTPVINPVDTDAYNDMFLVEGMVPFGGMSGAPVIDKEGRLRGVMSGGFPNDAASSKDFKGARVANIRGISTLLESIPSSVYTIPRAFSDNK